MKKETVYYYEPLVTTCETTPYHILEDHGVKYLAV